MLIAGFGFALKVALDAKSDNSKLRSDLAATRSELAQQNDDLLEFRLAVSTDSLSDDVEAMRLAILSAIDDASFLADDARAAVDSLRDCLNRHMDVIADWSSNVNSHYEYRRC